VRFMCPACYGKCMSCIDCFGVLPYMAMNKRNYTLLPDRVDCKLRGHTDIKTTRPIIMLQMSIMYYWENGIRRYRYTNFSGQLTKTETPQRNTVSREEMANRECPLRFTTTLW
jgi:hypothetical protein